MPADEVRRPRGKRARRGVGRRQERVGERLRRDGRYWGRAEIKLTKMLDKARPVMYTGQHEQAIA